MTAHDHEPAPRPAGEAPVPVWSIRPEPDDEELVALVTVLTMAMSRPASPATAPEPTSRWAKAGRAAAINRWPPAMDRGWRRQRTNFG